VIRFFLISLLLHGLLLVAWPARDTQPRMSSHPVSVKLVGVEMHSAPAAGQADDRPSPTRKPSPPVEPGRQQRDTPHETVSQRWQGDTRTAPRESLQSDSVRPEADIRAMAQEPVQDGSAGTAEPADSGNDTFLVKVRTAVMSALRANFSYPRRARIRGWEGTVVIALHILPDGGICNVRIADSSGIAVLDKAALGALRGVRVPRAVAWLEGREMDMIIPVEYRLTDS
jgi:protein TonB